MTLAYGSAGQVECGVTQDKSACVQQATITNGGGGFMRVMADRRASRWNGYILHYDCDLARVGFLHAISYLWCTFTATPNTDGISSRAIWCM
jgi:hypothetical protein